MPAYKSDAAAAKTAAAAHVDASIARADEADRATFGQRRVNLIWEMTQSVIALAVAGTTLYVSASLVLRGGADLAAFVLLGNTFFLIVGFYFGRTNHEKTGGVPKALDYEDRR
jgi:hypothetical protein